MKKISFSWIIIAILIGVIVVMGMCIQTQISAGNKEARLMLSDNTPMADVSGPASEIEALRILAPENHMPCVYSCFYKDVEKRKFYQEQLKAIDYAKDHEIKAAIPELILYLDYPTSGMEAGLKDFAHGAETERAEKVWPAFGALLEIPGSGALLQDYCLAPIHPLRYRLAAFAVLQFIDTNLPETCWQKLKAEGQEAQFQQEYDTIKAGHGIFWGMQDEDWSNYCK